MFSYFKINDPFRLVAVLLVAVLLRLPCLFQGCAHADMLYNLAVGEAMAYGSLYYMVGEPVAPLAALVYRLLEMVAGRSALVLHLAGLLLMVGQAVIFNNLTIRNKVYAQNTYLPALLYVLVASLHYSLSVLSPAQMGLTFVLLAFNRLLSHVEFRAKRDEQIMSIGLLLGLATLFYLPYLYFLPLVLLLLSLFTATLARRYVILLISALVPLAITILYYRLLHGTSYYFYHYLFRPSLAFGVGQLSDMARYWPLWLLPGILWGLGYLTMPAQRRLNNYQKRLAALFLFTGLVALGVFLFLRQSTPAVLLTVILPVVVFATVHLFYLIRKPLADWLYSLLLVAAVLFTAYDNLWDLAGLVPSPQPPQQVSPRLQEVIQGRRLLVIGRKRDLYLYGKIGSPFSNWELSASVFANPAAYDNLLYIREGVERYRPQVILDYERKWRIVLEKIPAWQDQYRQIRPFVWVRKEG